MTNWKLGAFFIISLMLIAGLFSNTAIAADSDGTVVANWGNRALVDDPLPTLTQTDGTTTPNETTPLNAGSKRNVVQFTYTSTEEERMAGGKVRIAFPAGWTLGDKIADDEVATKTITETDYYQYVNITVNPDGVGAGTVLYATAAMLDTTLLPVEMPADEKTAKSRLDMVNLTATMVEVTLPSDWTTGSLTIRLGTFNTPIPSSLPETDGLSPVNPYADGTFTASSSARNGTLSNLSAHPSVRVGTIIGDFTYDTNEDVADVQYPLPTSSGITAYAGRDTLKRILKVSTSNDGSKVYGGEKDVRFELAFTAPGPIYGEALTIRIPVGIGYTGTDPASETVESLTNNHVSQRGGAMITVGNITEGSVLITLDKINVGQRVVITYTRKAPIIGADSFSATIGTDAGNALAVEGGIVSTVAGSGGVTLDPDFAKAGATSQKFTFTYTASADLNGQILQITPMGIIITDDDTTDNVDTILQTGNPSGYGYVSTPDSSSKGTLDVNTEGDTIEWTNLNLNSGQTLTAYINRVDVSDRAQAYGWTVKVGTQRMLT